MLTIAPNSTNEIDGGTIGPTVAAAAITALANAGRKPRSFISGNKTVPVAAQSASAEPEVPDMMKFAVTATLARPPLRWPTSEAAKRTMRWVTPDTFINSPAKMNSGMANSTKASTPTVICWANNTIGVGLSANCDSVRYPKQAMPMAQAISMPNSENANNSPIMPISSMSAAPADAAPVVADRPQH